MSKHCAGVYIAWQTLQLRGDSFIVNHTPAIEISVPALLRMALLKRLTHNKTTCKARKILVNLRKTLKNQK